MKRTILLAAAMLAFEGSFAVAQPPDPVEKPAPDQGTEADDQDAPAATDPAPDGGDPAGAQVDSVHDDSSQETPEWMIGRWCAPGPGLMNFTITADHQAIRGPSSSRLLVQDRRDGTTEVFA